MKNAIFFSLLLAGCAANPSVHSATDDTATTQPTLEAPKNFVAPRGTSGQQGLVNRTVRVFFRRDALGYAGPVPLDPVMASTGGRSMTVEGVVRAVEPEWITLEGASGQMKIIRGDAILLVEVIP